jgi:glycosyltransferase involved in cell wall biosynthesis
MKIKEMKFVFLSHEQEAALTGYPDILADYLRERGARLIHIRYPFNNSITKSIWIEHYDGEKLISKKRSWIRFYRPEPVSFAKDVLWTLTVGAWLLRGSDFVIASTNLMGFTAYILKKLGIIKRYTFLMVDYSPVRFKNPIIEWIYRKVDRIATINADSVWPIRLSMLEGRVDAGRFKKEEVKKIIEAPMGTYSELIFRNGEPAYNKHHLVYIGNGNAKNVRADIMVDMAAELRNMGEKFKLILIASGSTENLRKKVKDLNLEEFVQFQPLIPSSIDLEKFVSKCGVGLAPYDPYLNDNFSKFADPGKIKNYIGCGLPVLTTVVPPIAREIESTGAGKIADLTGKDFADKARVLWADDAAYRRSRQAARELGSQYDWNQIFNRIMTAEGIDFS